MLLTERSRTETDVTRAAPRPVVLRLHAGTPGERLFPIDAGKHSVGSGPRCSVRLQEPGLRPVHCLISRDAEGLRVRRWAAGTLLNGAEFDEAPLASGDVLSVGTLELEVVESAPKVDADLLRRVEPDFEAAEPKVEMTEAAPADCLDREPAAEEFNHLREASLVARRRSRKLLAALRDNREVFSELIERLDALEQKVEAAVSDRDGLDEDQHVEPSIVADKSDFIAEPEQPFTGWDRERAEPDAESRWPEPEAGGVAPDDWTSAPPSDPALFEAINAAEQQLADAERQLADDQATIETLEQQLAELQRERELHAEERADWLRQTTALEARLDDYARRVPELESQLQQLCEAGEAAVRERRSSPRPTLVVAPPAVEPEAEFNWATHAADGDSDIAAEFGQPGWGSPAADAQPTEPTAAASRGDDQPANEFDRSTPGRTNVPDRTEWSAEADEWDVETSARVDSAIVDDPAVAADADTFGPGPRDESPVFPDGPAATQRKSDELDSMVAQLRGLSLWREEAEDAGQSTVAHSAAPVHELVPAVEPPPAEQSVAAPETAPAAAASDASPPASAPDSRTASFIERYSHLFEGEEAHEPAAAPQPSSPPADQYATSTAREPAAVRPPLAEPAPARDSDEESMELYMAKMMQRLRGDSPSVLASQAPPPAPAKSQRLPNEPSAGASAGVAGADSPEPPLPDKTGVVIRPQRKRGAAPETNTDMAALRALANQTARHALGVHAAGKMRRHAKTRFIIAMLAGTASLYFFLASPGWESLEFATATVTLLVSIYWGRRTFGSLVEGVRAGAFDDYDTEFAAVSPASDELPIDVEH